MSLSPGAKLGPYTIKKQLGRGGMAVVWLAEGGGRRVAIKEPILAASQEERERNVRFVRHEGELLSKINHEHVCKLYAVLESKTDKTPYLVLEYLDGGSLRERLYPDPKALKAVAKQILYGLSEVHRLGIIHRDLKPSNLMVGGGKIKIVDFGTALSYQQKALEIVVSPGGYTAPEQLRGIPLFQSDVWSVGATLVYLYTGNPPCKYMKGYSCDGDITGPVEATPPPTGDPTLDTFIKTALSPNHRARYFDANEALAYLEGTLPKEIAGLKIRIRTKIFVVKTGNVVIGRTDNPKEDLKTEGGVIYIFDPKQYISRRHVEIAEIRGEWYIRDLGSTNGTAILREKWHNISRGKGITGQWHKLEHGDIIALGYDEEKGPYEIVGIKTA